MKDGGAEAAVAAADCRSATMEDHGGDTEVRTIAIRVQAVSSRIYMALEDRDNQLSDSVRRRRTAATDSQILCDGGEPGDRSMMSVRLQLIDLYSFWVFRSSSLFSRFVCFGMFWFNSWIHLLMGCGLDFVCWILAIINMYLFSHCMCDNFKTLEQN